MVWDCGIPGVAGTPWEGGTYKMQVCYYIVQSIFSLYSVYIQCVKVSLNLTFYLWWRRRMMQLKFCDQYPSKPPAVFFTPVLFHMNLYPSGRVCLDIVNEGENWQPGITMRQILVGCQSLLDNPNPGSPAQSAPYELHKKNKVAYRARCVQEAKKHATDA